MGKGPPAYNPDLGDFRFGVVDGSGVRALDETTGQARTGGLEACYACDVRRAEQGFLFGAPLDNRMPYMEFDAAPR